MAAGACLTAAHAQAGKPAAPAALINAGAGPAPPRAAKIRTKNAALPRTAAAICYAVRSVLHHRPVAEKGSSINAAAPHYPTAQWVPIVERLRMVVAERLCAALPVRQDKPV